MPSYLDFGTGSSPIVCDRRVYLLQDNEQQPLLAALDVKTGAELWRTARAGTGFPVKSSWMTPFVWKNAVRTEIITTGQGGVVAYDTQGQELRPRGRSRAARSTSGPSRSSTEIAQ